VPVGKGVAVAAPRGVTAASRPGSGGVARPPLPRYPAAQGGSEPLAVLLPVAARVLPLRSCSRVDSLPLGPRPHRGVELLAAHPAAVAPRPVRAGHVLCCAPRLFNGLRPK